MSSGAGTTPLECVLFSSRCGWTFCWYHLPYSSRTYLEVIYHSCLLPLCLNSLIAVTMVPSSHFDRVFLPSWQSHYGFKVVDVAFIWTFSPTSYWVYVIYMIPWNFEVGMIIVWGINIQKRHPGWTRVWWFFGACKATSWLWTIIYNFLMVPIGLAIIITQFIQCNSIQFICSKVIGCHLY